MRVVYAAASLAGADPRHSAGLPTGPGPSKANQDAWIAHERAGGGESLLLGVLDGHGVDGGLVSAAAAARLPRLAADAGLGRSDAGGAAGGLAKKGSPGHGSGRWPGVRGPPSADTARRRGLSAGEGGVGGRHQVPLPGWARDARDAHPATPPTDEEEDDDEDASSGGGGCSGTPLASGSAGSGAADGGGSGGNSSSAWSGGPSHASGGAAAAGGAAGVGAPAHHHHRHHHHHPTAVSSRLARAAGAVLALDAALARAHACVLAAPGIDCSLSGSTAALAAIDGDGLAVAHVGDSRILLGRLDPAGAPGGQLLPALALTDDHTPGRPDEARRILAARGRIGSYTHCGQPVGPLRVWLPHADAPGLCMTRALGDTVAAAAGVTARAETGARRLEAGDRYLVLLSDGVHEFWSNDDIMATVHAVAGAGGSPADAAAALVRVARGQWEAAEAGAADDCTAVVAFLDVES